VGFSELLVGESSDMRFNIAALSLLK